MEEIWKPIAGYEGLYEVSNLGRVRSLDRYIEQPNPHNGTMQKVLRKGCIMRESLTKAGYKKVTISKGNRVFKNYDVHRLVASAFVSNPNNYKYVNHKDDNKENNIYTNLEWCTNEYNSNYGNKSPKRMVYQYDMNNVLIAKFESITAASKSTNINVCTIGQACLGKYKTAGGYIWKYAN